jgi:hypothetical protein
MRLFAGHYFLYSARWIGPLEALTELLGMSHPNCAIRVFAPTAEGPDQTKSCPLPGSPAAVVLTPTLQ